MPCESSVSVKENPDRKKIQKCSALLNQVVILCIKQEVHCFFKEISPRKFHKAKNDVRPFDVKFKI